mmetsp:Transcript_800/g.2444  ORF Transcript_800/g.2444 Transcript_800/m.2444 type:complete len:202 (+) Transcript_800:1390-1995(+)
MAMAPVAVRRADTSSLYIVFVASRYGRQSSSNWHMEPPTTRRLNTWYSSSFFSASSKRSQCSLSGFSSISRRSSPTVTPSNSSSYRFLIDPLSGTTRPSSATLSKKSMLSCFTLNRSYLTPVTLPVMGAGARRAPTGTKAARTAAELNKSERNASVCASSNRRSKRNAASRDSSSTFHCLNFSRSSRSLTHENSFSIATKA